MVLREQYYASFILPSTKKLIASRDALINENKTLEIMDYYHSVISQFVAQRYCIKLFGKDVTMIIMELYGVGSYQFDKEKSVLFIWLNAEKKIVIIKYSILFIIKMNGFKPTNPVKGWMLKDVLL